PSFLAANLIALRAKRDGFDPPVAPALLAADPPRQLRESLLRSIALQSTIPPGTSTGGTPLDRITISAGTSNRTTDQNTPVDFSTIIHTSKSGDYSLYVDGPEVWALSIDDSGQVTVTPAPGTQGGTYPIRLTVRSVDEPNLVASSEVFVTVT